jgi:hypothetical protein
MGLLGGTLLGGGLLLVALKMGAGAALLQACGQLGGGVWGGGGSGGRRAGDDYGTRSDESKHGSQQRRRPHSAAARYAHEEDWAGKDGGDGCVGSAGVCGGSCSDGGGCAGPYSRSSWRGLGALRRHSEQSTWDCSAAGADEAVRCRSGSRKYSAGAASIRGVSCDYGSSGNGQGSATGDDERGRHRSLVQGTWRARNTSSPENAGWDDSAAGGYGRGSRHRPHAGHEWPYGMRDSTAEAPVRLGVDRQQQLRPHLSKMSSGRYNERGEGPQHERRRSHTESFLQVPPALAPALAGMHTGQARASSQPSRAQRHSRQHSESESESADASASASRLSALLIHSQSAQPRGSSARLDEDLHWTVWYGANDSQTTQQRALQPTRSPPSIRRSAGSTLASVSAAPVWVPSAEPHPRSVQSSPGASSSLPSSNTVRRQPSIRGLPAGPEAFALLHAAAGGTRGGSSSGIERARQASTGLAAMQGNGNRAWQLARHDREGSNNRVTASPFASAAVPSSAAGASSQPPARTPRDHQLALSAYGSESRVQRSALSATPLRSPVIGRRGGAGAPLYQPGTTMHPQDMVQCSDEEA